MKKGKYLAIGVLVIVVGGAITARMMRREVRPTHAKEHREQKEPKDPTTDPAPDTMDDDEALPVKVVHPRKGALERLCTQPGSVHSFEAIQLFAQVPGFLETQTVDIGVKCKKGDVLATIFVPNIKAQVERNEAAVDKAKAQLLQMQSRVDVANANLKAAEAAVVQAIATADSAAATVRYRKIQLGRMDALVKSSSIEERLFDESKERHDAAMENENAARAAIATTKANVIACQAKIEQAKADVIEAEAETKVAKAELKKSQVNLDFATIRAPFDGIITYRSMNPGDFVRAANDAGNSRPLLTIVRTDKFRVVVLAPDRDVEKLSVGMPTMMKIDSLPDREFHPTVSRIATALDPHTRLMRVELDLKNDKDGKIYHDMYGQVTIVLDKGENELSIPTSCVAGKVEDGKASIYVVESGRARKIDIKVGMDSGLRLIVEKVLTKGVVLNESSQVITDPVSDLAKQPEVIPTPWDDTPTIQLTNTGR